MYEKAPYSEISQPLLASDLRRLITVTYTDQVWPGPDATPTRRD